MKLFHLADLHIGKQVHGVSLLPDQRYILEQVLEAVLDDPSVNEREKLLDIIRGKTE